MHCLINYLPVEIIVLILQQLCDRDVVSFMTAFPGFVEKNPLLKEYICYKVTLCVSLTTHGLGVVATDSLKTVSQEDWTLFRSLNVGMGRAKRWKHYAGLDMVSRLERLQRVRLVHHDGELLSRLLELLPISVVVLELVLDGAVKGKWKGEGATTGNNCFPLGKKERLLKMVTVINTSKWNQKMVKGISTRILKRDVLGPANISDTAILRTSYGTYTQSHNQLHRLGLAVGKFLYESRNSVQNIGVFGIDAIWLMDKTGWDFPELRIVKVGGESMARTVIWAPNLLQKNPEKKEFTNGQFVRPMVVVFSKMLNQQCKVVLSGNRYVLVGGSGVELFREYTYL